MSPGDWLNEEPTPSRLPITSLSKVDHLSVASLQQPVKVIVPVVDVQVPAAQLGDLHVEAAQPGVQPAPDDAGTTGVEVADKEFCRHKAVHLLLVDVALVPAESDLQASVSL